MSMPVARVGDIGIGTCSAHRRTKSVVVVLVSGAGSVLTNGTPTANATTVGVSSCGHSTIAASFSATVFAEKAGVHRAGDIGLLPGGVYIQSGASANVFSG